MRDLKPCPFCGSKAKLSEDTVWMAKEFHGYEIECTGCTATVVGRRGLTEENKADLIADWQMRSGS